MEDKFCNVLKMTCVGTGFVGLGAALNTYVPAFHKPVSWVERTLNKSSTVLSSAPATSFLFKDNPLTQNKAMTEFLAVNIIESALIGTVIVAAGVGMRTFHIAPKHIENVFPTVGRQP
jgi:hypothetical protein